ncbi:pre-mRNA-splicing factor 38B-like [Antedon mediterranea]|uniref:pre-mRNA-splicing factor 38B-like n=1 Tax=Antedon mediterranea TaxID=105859 RepID=UPI003AF4D007
MAKKGNTLPFWGNENTMNLNSLVLTNIQSSPYFKNGLIKLKTYHEVIDEIYYKVDHLEPWERGSRQTAGQVGMCGGVRGVGCGGIVSSAYCLLFKLYTLKLTRKQLNGLLTHTDSPFIRGLGFMFIRYTAPPSDLFDWFEPYLNDEEEIDPKAGTGAPMTIGEMLRGLLTKQDWFSTLFPRIPVPVMKEIERRMPPRNIAQSIEEDPVEEDIQEEKERDRYRSRTSPDIRRPKSPERTHSRSRDVRDKRSRSRERRRSRSPVRKRRSRSRDHIRRSRSREKNHRENERRRSRSRERRRSPHRSHKDSRSKPDFSDALQREKARQEKESKKRHRSRSRSKDRNEERRKDKSRRDRSESRERKKHKKSKKHKRERSRSRDLKRSSSQDR